MLVAAYPACIENGNCTLVCGHPFWSRQNPVPSMRVHDQPCLRLARAIPVANLSSGRSPFLTKLRRSNSNAPVLILLLTLKSRRLAQKKKKCQTVKVHIEILVYVLAWLSRCDMEVSYQNLHSTSVYLDSAWIETDKISASCSPDLRKSCLKGTSGAFGSCLTISDFYLLF